ncbi:hypothetical protein HF086_009556 [Spodoptera exigua]|uniref:DUF7869 domain-containing protein n=1 Tax=Spodoptera exigua TaxID=7107 RepID=A0A922SAE1_SPOEX|nr:hypothetical protein HF086_009556 [Spodoptera exigua]
MESHYIRKKSKRKYLDRNLTLCKLYSLYVKKCEDENKEPVSEMTYRRIFSTEFNLGFFMPKKDQCLLCTMYNRANPEEKNKIQEEYQTHIVRKQTCNQEKDKDKKRAEEETNLLSATFDLQAILQLPCTDVGLLYYTRKLTLYNLTLYESAPPNEAYCFVWSEINGKKGSSEIGSILCHYLMKCVPEEVTEVSLFSDTCGGQNRNQFVAAILLWVIQNSNHLQIIEHKFLESGHSYMEADSMHSAIESAKKNVDLFCMTDWINIFKRARSKKRYRKNTKTITKNCYQVKEFKYNEFKDLTNTIILNRTKNTDGQQVKWLKIKRMKYIKGDKKIYYNYDMSNSFMAIDVTASDTQNKININSALTSSVHGYHSYATRNKAKRLPAEQVIELPTTSELQFPPLEQLYDGPLPITEAKKKDLINLCEKGVIPEEYHGWYRSFLVDRDRTERVPDVAASEESQSKSSVDSSADE